MHYDLRGNPIGTSSPVARDAAERALWRMMSFYDVPMADLDAAIEVDPAWLLPRVMKAGFLLSLTEPAQNAEAERLLDEARALEGGATARERAHLEATLQVADGRWQAACRTWDDLLLAHPHDALALQWANLWDFYRGDAASMRARPARVLPEWSEDDPLYAYVLSLHAFGLEECHLYPQAEEAGRRALAANPRVPWAVHAVAHVMEMQGRFDDGAAWLRTHQPAWAEGNGFSTHLWWHLALFRLEALDHAGALRLADAHLCSDDMQISLQRLDAAALLWRLKLLDVDVGDRFRALADAWHAADIEQSQAGHYAFNDVHALIAQVGAGETARAEHWLSRCAERAMSPDDARRSNHLVAREVGVPLMRGLLAFARGDYDAAAQALYPVRAIAQRFGGSHAQRDLIDQTLLAATALGSQHKALGRALINERLMAKPATPLTREWMQRLGGASRAQSN